MVDTLIEEYREPKKTAKDKLNGKAKLIPAHQPLPFTLENLEVALWNRYENIGVKENTWNKGYYDISVYINHEQTAEEIKIFMSDMFGKSPLGGHLNHETREKVHLFQYYKTENNIFHIGFYNVSPKK